jgi:aspartate ammonia-lyase
LKLLEHTAMALTEKCINGITAQEENCRKNFERSAGLPTVLNPKLGYDRVAQLVKESLSNGKTLRELVLEKKILSETEFDDLLRRSTGPNL